MITLDPRHADIVRSILAQHVPGREVRVFGSRAKGTAKPSSDLDLAIFGDDLLPFSRYAKMCSAFEDSDLPFKVDIVEVAKISPAFRAVIETDGVAFV